MPPTFGVPLEILIDVRSTAAGGRSHAIVNGYRPVCAIGGPDGETTIGLCELQLDHPIAPGTSGIGRLSFDVAVSDEVRALLQVGSTFALVEGRHPIADAEVRGMGR